MKDFEEFINKNRSSFDHIEPKFKTWTEQSRNQDSEFNEVKKQVVYSSNNWVKKIMKIAAVFVFISLTILINNQKNKSNVFENVAIPAPDGEIITLDPSKNTYTLVQFWESGNVLCSENNCYYYMPAYEKYKEHGFEIYAISLDEYREEWLRGIEENNLPWIHVSDLSGWESPICIECNISKVPTSFLLNQKGEIIRNNLDASELDETLGQLLAIN